MPGQGEEGVAKVTLAAYFGILVGVLKDALPEAGGIAGWQNDGQAESNVVTCLATVSAPSLVDGQRSLAPLAGTSVWLRWYR